MDHATRPTLTGIAPFFIVRELASSCRAESRSTSRWERIDVPEGVAARDGNDVVPVRLSSDVLAFQPTHVEPGRHADADC